MINRLGVCVLFIFVRSLLLITQAIKYLKTTQKIFTSSTCADFGLRNFGRTNRNVIRRRFFPSLSGAILLSLEGEFPVSDIGSSSTDCRIFKNPNDDNFLFLARNCKGLFF